MKRPRVDREAHRAKPALRAGIRHESAAALIPLLSRPGEGAEARTRRTEPVGRIILFLGISLLATIVALVPVVGNGFTNWDDDHYVVNNRTIRQLDLGTVRTMFAGPFEGTYVPLVLLSFAIDYRVSGLKPAAFHLTNLVLHVANTALVFLLVFLWDRRSLSALVVSLLFGVHPLHVEPVAWITARKDLLFAFFFLISLIWYCRFLTGGRRAGAYALSFASFVLAMFSKVVASTVPAVLLLIDVARGRRDVTRMAVEKLPFVAVAVPLGILNVMAERGAGATGAESAYTLFEKVLMAGYLLLFYALKVVLPFGLSAFYPYPLRSGSHLPLQFFVVSALAVAALATFCYLACRSRAALLGGGFFLLSILPVLQLVPVGAAFAADRFAYVPMIGLLFVLGAAASQFGEKPGVWKRWDRAVVCAVVLISLAFAAVSWRRALVWKDSVTLWNSVLSRDPGCVVALSNRGAALTQLRDYEGATNDLERARTLAPYFAPIYWGLGEIAGNRGEFGRAVELFSQAIERDPGYAAAYYKRGVAYYRQMEYGKAREDVSRAFALGYTVHPELARRLEQETGRPLAGAPGFAEAPSEGSTGGDAIPPVRHR